MSVADSPVSRKVLSPPPSARPQFMGIEKKRGRAATLDAAPLNSKQKERWEALEQRQITVETRFGSRAHVTVCELFNRVCAQLDHLAPIRRAIYKGSAVTHCVFGNQDWYNDIDFCIYIDEVNEERFKAIFDQALYHTLYDLLPADSLKDYLFENFSNKPWKTENGCFMLFQIGQAQLNLVNGELKLPCLEGHHSFYIARPKDNKSDPKLGSFLAPLEEQIERTKSNKMQLPEDAKLAGLGAFERIMRSLESNILPSKDLANRYEQAFLEQRPAPAFQAKALLDYIDKNRHYAYDDEKVFYLLNACISLDHCQEGAGFALLQAALPRLNGYQVEDPLLKSYLEIAPLLDPSMALVALRFFFTLKINSGSEELHEERKVQSYRLPQKSPLPRPRARLLLPELSDEELKRLTHCSDQQQELLLKLSLHLATDKPFTLQLSSSQFRLLSKSKLPLFQLLALQLALVMAKKFSSLHLLDCYLEKQSCFTALSPELLPPLKEALYQHLRPFFSGAWSHKYLETNDPHFSPYLLARAAIEKGSESYLLKAIKRIEAPASTDDLNFLKEALSAQDLPKALSFAKELSLNLNANYKEIYVALLSKCDPSSLGLLSEGDLLHLSGQIQRWVLPHLDAQDPIEKIILLAENLPPEEQLSLLRPLSEAQITISPERRTRLHLILLPRDKTDKKRLLHGLAQLSQLQVDPQALAQVIMKANLTQELLRHNEPFACLKLIRYTQTAQQVPAAQKIEILSKLKKNKTTIKNWVEHELDFIKNPFEIIQEGFYSFETLECLLGQIVHDQIFIEKLSPEVLCEELMQKLEPLSFERLCTLYQSSLTYPSDISDTIWEALSSKAPSYKTDASFLSRLAVGIKQNPQLVHQYWKTLHSELAALEFVDWAQGLPLLDTACAKLFTTPLSNDFKRTRAAVTNCLTDLDEKPLLAAHLASEASELLCVALKGKIPWQDLKPTLKEKAENLVERNHYHSPSSSSSLSSILSPCSKLMHEWQLEDEPPGSPVGKLLSSKNYPAISSWWKENKEEEGELVLEQKETLIAHLDKLDIHTAISIWSYLWKKIGSQERGLQVARNILLERLPKKNRAEGDLTLIHSFLDDLEKSTEGLKPTALSSLIHYSLHHRIDEVLERLNEDLSLTPQQLPMNWERLLPFLEKAPNYEPLMAQMIAWLGETKKLRHIQTAYSFYLYLKEKHSAAIYKASLHLMDTVEALNEGLESDPSDLPKFTIICQLLELLYDSIEGADDIEENKHIELAQRLIPILVNQKMPNHENLLILSATSTINQVGRNLFVSMHAQYKNLKKQLFVTELFFEKSQSNKESSLGRIRYLLCLIETGRVQPDEISRRGIEALRLRLQEDTLIDFISLENALTDYGRLLDAILKYRSQLKIDHLNFELGFLHTILSICSLDQRKKTFFNHSLGKRFLKDYAEIFKLSILAAYQQNIVIYDNQSFAMQAHLLLGAFANNSDLELFKSSFSNLVEIYQFCFKTGQENGGVFEAYENTLKMLMMSTEQNTKKEKQQLNKLLLLPLLGSKYNVEAIADIFERHFYLLLNLDQVKQAETCLEIVKAKPQFLTEAQKIAMEDELKKKKTSGCQIPFANIRVLMDLLPKLYCNPKLLAERGSTSSSPPPTAQEAGLLKKKIICKI